MLRCCVVKPVVSVSLTLGARSPRSAFLALRARCPAPRLVAVALSHHPVASVIAVDYPLHGGGRNGDSSRPLYAGGRASDVGGQP